MLSSIILSSYVYACSQKKIELADIPEKPVVETCFINVDLGRLDCKTIRNIWYTRSVYDADKYVCFDPKEWEKIGNYNIELRRVARSSCKCN